MFNMEAENDDVNLEDLKFSINPKPGMEAVGDSETLEKSRGTQIKKESGMGTDSGMFDDSQEQLKFSRSGSQMQKSTPFLGPNDLDNPYTKKIDQLENEIILLTRMIEEKDIVIDDMRYKNVMSTGQLADAVT